MSYHPHPRSVRSLLTAAGLVAVGMALPTPAFAQNAAPAAEAKATTAGAQLDKAADLMTAGKYVQAKGMIATITRDGGLSLSDAERTRAMTILNNANRKIKGLTPVELSLQTAADSIEHGDYRTAERQLTAVIAHPQATRLQSDEATKHLQTVKTKRTELAPQLSGLITQAKMDFEAGRYPQAKAAFETVSRSGLELSPTQQDTVISLQTKIVDLETKQGSLFRTDAGMVQPGVVKPREPQPAETPAAQPETPAPTNVPPPPEQAPSSQQPATTPAPVAPPVPMQPSGQPGQPETDVLTRAQRLEAQALLAEANAAFEQSRYNEADLKYGRVLNTYGQFLTSDEAQQARSKQAEARTRLNEGNPGDLNDVKRIGDLRHQAALAEFRNDMERAARANETGSTNEAIDLVAAGRQVLNASREFFSQTEYDALMGEANTLRADIDRADATRRQKETESQLTQIQRDADTARREAERQKELKINESIARVRALQKEMKYDEALQVCDQILFLDPINPSGLVLRDVILDTQTYVNYFNTQKVKQRSYATQGLENQAALIAPPHIMEYPADWPKVVYGRGEPAAFADAEENRRVLATLQTKRIPADFNENPLEAVLTYVAQVSNVNMDVDWQRLEEKGIERTTPVTLKLTNVSIETVLDRVVEKVSPDATAGAAWTINSGVLYVSTREQINKSRTLAIYDIRDLLIEVPDYTQAPEFDLQSVLQNQGGRGGGGSSQSPFRENNQQQQQPQRTLQERTQQIEDLITNNVDSAGWSVNGGDVGAIQELSGSLIITNTPANHRAIQGLLRKLREVRSMQINVETRFLLVSQDYFEQIGFDIDLYFNANNNQVRAARATLPNTQASDFFDFTAGGYQGGLLGSSTAPFAGQRPSHLSPIAVAQNSLGISEGLTSGAFANGLVSGAPALGVAGQFLDDVQVDFLIKATQADRRTVALTAPRLTFTNGQTSNIYVATQIAFVSDLTPVVSESAVGFDPTLGAVNEGVRLLVQGTVSSDRRYVTLNVDASVSKVEGFQNTPVSAVAGGQLVNSAATQSFLQRPTTTVTRVQTTVTVPDQGTILLGGQRLVTEQEVESGVPVLSKIPILNRFFSNRITSKEEQTLLILLKPTILIQNEEEERNFPGLPDSGRVPFASGFGG